MRIAVSNRVIARNAIGRFIADCEQAQRETARDLVEMGDQIATGLAPVKTGRLKASMGHRMLSATSGIFYADAPYSLFQEEGTGPRTMIGSPYFKFFWEAQGRMWIPGLMGTPDIINHPGNPPQPFLRPAYEMVMAQAMAVARANYP